MKSEGRKLLMVLASVSCLVALVSIIELSGIKNMRWECTENDWNVTWYVDCHAPYSGVWIKNGSLWVDYAYCHDAPIPCIKETLVRDVK